jgi:hypothetical protein
MFRESKVQKRLFWGPQVHQNRGENPTFYDHLKNS